MDGTYIICERPHLSDFMDWLFKNFNVSVWTAASKDYALFIIKNSILCGKEDRKLQFIFFDYHCDLSQEIYKKDPQKCLKMLTDQGAFKLPNIKLDNIVIIDDLQDNKESNGNNCIQIFPFKVYGIGSESDNHLMTVVKDKLEDIKNYVLNKI